MRGGERLPGCGQCLVPGAACEGDDEREILLAVGTDELAGPAIARRLQKHGVATRLKILARRRRGKP